MDEKARAMLMLGLLNDAFGDVRGMLYYLQDFVMSHPEMKDEMEEFGLNEVVEMAKELERKILEKMDVLKRVIEGGEGGKGRE